MEKFDKNIIFIAFLRGINVGGHHKVPMAELRKELANIGCENVVTILNSGNVIFECKNEELNGLEKRIAEHLEKAFGFPIPTIIRTAKVVLDLYHSDPFNGIELTKEKRFYISFLHKDMKGDVGIPWESEDKSFKILVKKAKTIISVLDLSISQTPKAMKALENLFGKGITTRNWNTIKRIEGKLVK